MIDGYLYCFSNQSMAGILKIGMTESDPDIKLNESNSSDTWRPPTPYKIEFAKKVLNPYQKETTLHALLTQYTERINPNCDFFRVSIADVKIFFDLIDGEWVEQTKEYNKTYIKEQTNEQTKEYNKTYKDDDIIYELFELIHLLL